MQAKAEGIAAVTHKIGEGRSYDDPLDSTNLGNARAAGLRLLGGYYVVRSGDVGAQVDNLIALADRDEPWWSGFAGWFWQVDLERWSYDQVPAATGIAFGQLLRQRTGRQVLMYASRGQYGDQLTGWDGSLWNADYPSSRQDGFASLYPGDDYRGWAPYSGQTPALLQYASSATIGGATTCDCSAFRGSYDQLNSLLTGQPRDTTAMLLIKVANDPTVYVSDGISYRPMTSEPAFNAAIAAGHQLVTVQDVSQLEDLAGKPAGSPAPMPVPTPTPMPTVTLTEADRKAIVAGLVGALPSVATIAKAVNDDVAARMTARTVV